MRTATAKDRRSGEIGSIGIFSSLEPDELELVRSSMRTRECKAGETLFVEGSAGDELFVVRKGSVGIFLALGDGKELPISQVASGGFFGEMSLIERAPRSATCKALEDSTLLSLHAADFDKLMLERPAIAARVMQSMLSIAAGRLFATGSFLSQMVQWGESARKRAVTDEATGLFNRRFFDDSAQALFDRAGLDGGTFSVAMFDLDRFGALNKEHGLAFGDEAIVAAAGAFRRVFREKDVLVRYGGDEFTFLLPDTGTDEAVALCSKVCEEIRALRFPSKPGLSLTASLGVATYPDHARSLDSLVRAADRALYFAKEAGRNRALGPPAQGGAAGGIKREFKSIAEKNRIVRNILDALESRDGVMILGHRNPDEDCIASMVAFGLFASKFNNDVCLVRNGARDAAQAAGGHDQFEYLLSICAYNSIRILDVDETPPFAISTVVALDTPKPSMLDAGKAVLRIFDDPATLRIEIDHHLEADSTYSGDFGYNLVTGASSASELVGLLGFKLDNDAERKARNQIEDVFSRNFVLSVLTGMIGDSRMGKYLKTRKERWYYEWFSSLFDRMLTQKTRRGSANFTTKEEVFTAIASLSGDEEECFRALFERKAGSGGLRYVILDADAAAALRERFGDDMLASVSKSVADVLAEECGKLGMVAFPDDDAVSDLVQFRLRRAAGFTAIDLRDVLSRFKFENGGGHPGAVGFRFPKSQVPDFAAFAADVVAKVESLLDPA